jgi:hypothetical protein
MEVILVIFKDLVVSVLMILMSWVVISLLLAILSMEMGMATIGLGLTILMMGIELESTLMVCDDSEMRYLLKMKLVYCWFLAKIVTVDVSLEGVTMIESILD